MKTVKIKVSPSSETIERYAVICDELQWLWNLVRRVALHNHCLDWYRWAAKNGVNLGGCSLVPLRFSKNGGWNGAACQIATGGAYFKKDEKAPLIKYRIKKGSKWESRTRHGYTRFDGDRPYERIEPKAHEFIEMPVYKKALGDVAMVPLKGRAWGLDNMGLLNRERVKQGLEELTCNSDFVGGLLADFEVAWNAYLDPNLPTRKKPKFKDGKEGRITTLNNNQKAISLVKGVFKGQGLTLAPCDRTWQARLGDQIPSAYKFTRKPSGWYLCLSVSSANESRLRLEIRQQNTLLGKVKKAAILGIKGKRAQAEVLGKNEEYQAALSGLRRLKDELNDDSVLTSGFSQRTGKRTGIDPGVKAIVATDHGALFQPNIKRERAGAHIEVLQARLDLIIERNDKRLGLSWKRGTREATNNESRLRGKISRLHERGGNSSNAFNHKLSTRLARTYDFISWEDTQLLNMAKTVQPKLAEGGGHYEQNGARAKTGLNRALRHACIGDLRAKTSSKVKSGRKLFVEPRAAYSSKECHCCHKVGDRVSQETFICLNNGCELFDVAQNADTNAAKNHLNNGLVVAELL